MPFKPNFWKNPIHILFQYHCNMKLLAQIICLTENRNFVTCWTKNEHMHRPWNKLSSALWFTVCVSYVVQIAATNSVPSLPPHLSLHPWRIVVLRSLLRSPVLQRFWLECSHRDHAHLDQRHTPAETLLSLHYSDKQPGEQRREMGESRRNEAHEKGDNKTSLSFFFFNWQCSLSEFYTKYSMNFCQLSY